MKLWLIEQDAARELQHIMQAAPLALSAEQLVAFRSYADSPEGPRCLRIAGNEAVITVSGVLTKAVDAYYYYRAVSSTSYRDITKALALAEQNPDVKRIGLEIDSPGGLVDGLFETMDAIRACKKPTTARCSLAASAAYGLASACKRIEAVGVASMFGSIGVAMTFYFWNAETVVDLANTDAPDKRPDVRTEEGKAVVRKELDAIADLFYDAIAIGRGVSAETIKTTYGRGAMFVAGDAKRLRMIDAVAASPALATSSTKVKGLGAALHEPPPGQAMAFAESVLLPLMGAATPTPSAASTTGDLGDAIVALVDRQNAAVR